MRRAFYLLLIFLLSFAYSNEDNEMARELFKVSGFETYAEQIPYTILIQLNSYCEENGLSSFTDDFLETAIDTTSNVFWTQFEKSFKKDEIEELLNWFKSDLGEEIKILEAKEFESEFNLSTLSESKKKLIDQLVADNKLEEFNILWAHEVGIVLVKSMILVPLKLKGTTDNKIDEFFASDKFKQVVDNNVQSTFDINNYYQTYSELSEKQLSDYIEFLNTDLGQKYVNFIMSTIQKVSTPLFDMVGSKIGNETDKLLQEKDSN